ncbi:SEC14 cytosolic factor family protein / phosphoglyceride transfer family protein isoform 1 [Galdieria sulphuraria]|uniref:SEC14 cytosolic factor family protein / phosphoglyceride transfer family protein isoform 1 n=1 Tax=Galdieria sulphuraria TaxID=130081 RepID=M2XE20_GALSU|nr:SEC14 cytosolic factor family protein / phosphoglyceride transfer family protein isoform 1 [Galdieria sulphuraria]EME28247.1 SEC14 cytosolic factor family protein / phosphoglyceride transfer family protein isoform 1 [Galdieria sulphuraria]|eukprot:XP_005704767.1 SEC14 cytosolic factor family protein / phosphoglyceride transfer family protein isoform 1 [Galdieria sulphuraria]
MAESTSIVKDNHIKGEVWAKPLDEETKQCLQSLRSKVNSILVDGSSKDVEWCDDACLLRYLRARNNQVDKALELVRRTLEWRKNFEVEELMNKVPPQVKEEGSSQKLYVGGKDKYGRPIIYMKPKYQNTKESIHQLQHLVYTLEKAIRRMQNGVEKLILFIDFEGYSMRNTPSIKMMRETLTVLQDYYPERLGLAICLNAPTLFYTFYKIIKPFIDKNTVQKIYFFKVNNTKKSKEWMEFAQQVFDLDELEVDYGGRNDKEYDPEEYFSS